MPEDKEKVIERVQTYTVKVSHFTDGTTRLDRSNDGFNAIELLGILSLSSADIIEQIRGNVKPDIVSRTVIVD